MCMEIAYTAGYSTVALRKESVDRNVDGHDHPARLRVALRKESVDRNAKIGGNAALGFRRSPQGERG